MFGILAMNDLDCWLLLERSDARLLIGDDGIATFTHVRPIVAQSPSTWIAPNDRVRFFSYIQYHDGAFGVACKRCTCSKLAILALPEMCSVSQPF
ncbi:hypothetical protein BVY11_27430 [Pseudomonas amygdali pv. morsprunorum]|nr:hypothetical protein BVY11_27430 [Pseudomonas amygdali pv. morsprunorum]